MLPEKKKYRDLSGFFTAGISYKKTDAALRGSFAITENQYAALLESAYLFGVEELFVLSTCNRTEIYAFAPDAAAVISLLCSVTTGSYHTFKKLAYIKNGSGALRHFFEVAAGLDSQLLGDYEILGQVKKAIQFSRERNGIGPYMERIISLALQSAKQVITKTGLSNGAVSVSFAAIRYLKETVPDIASKKILLAGAGKIGRSTCKNMVDYLGAKNITLVNRTGSRAAALAKELSLQYADYSKLPQLAAEADIIILATSSSTPVLQREHIAGYGAKVIIDLAVPSNTAAGIGELPFVTLTGVDALSQIKDHTISKREMAVPQAQVIINHTLNGFLKWHAARTTSFLMQAGPGIFYNSHLQQPGIRSSVNLQIH